MHGNCHTICTGTVTQCTDIATLYAQMRSHYMHGHCHYLHGHCHTIRTGTVTSYAHARLSHAICMDTFTPCTGTGTLIHTKDTWDIDVCTQAHTHITHTPGWIVTVLPGT